MDESAFSLPVVPPLQEVGTLAVKDQSKWVQAPKSWLHQLKQIPIEKWGIYIALVLSMMWISTGFAFLQMHHVVFVGIAIVIIQLHYSHEQVSHQAEFDSIMSMWKSLPGPTSSFYLDANLIIFFYEYRRVAEVHESGWQECIRQVNQLLRMSWESRFVQNDKAGFFANCRQTMERAMFHWHSVVFTLSDYPQKYKMWTRSIHDLQTLLWTHLHEIHHRLGLPSTVLDPESTSHHVSFPHVPSSQWYRV